MVAMLARPQWVKSDLILVDQWVWKNMSVARSMQGGQISMKYEQGIFDMYK